MIIIKTFKALAVGALIASATVTATSAATVNTISNVVFIVDESGSMGGEQAFLRDTVIDRLDTDLATAGVTSRSYGVVGFGGGGTGNSGRVLGGGLTDAAATKTNLGGLRLIGSTEDGYAGIDFALNAFSYNAGAAINFILVTDEDRDDTDASLNFGNILARLTGSRILLNAVVNNRFSTAAGDTALGLNDGEAYSADGSGGFDTSAGGVVGRGSGTTTADYVDLALQTGGAAWNLNELRSGGDDALSFASAFVSIKVDEIVSQPPSTPVVPVPAALPLLLGGIGMLGALRVRGRRARA